MLRYFREDEKFLYSPVPERCPLEAAKTQVMKPKTKQIAARAN
jgi:hypothetical protein